MHCMTSKSVLIAKNTLMLYSRQIFTMLVSLYTVRVVLEILGVEDYGIYGVVGGLVVFFMFLNVTNASQRFMNFALGRNDREQARDVYSTSIVIHVLIAVLVIILAQTIGLWFFHTQLNIPPERQSAALVAYQFFILAKVIDILQAPYRATIIAHEKMSFFAMLSIVEATFRLGIVFLLPVIQFDKLKAYVFLVCITNIVILLIHKIYCNRTFELARFRYCSDKELYRQMLTFSGWNVFGGLAAMSREHGINIMVNIFHGVTVNAALGIAGQINSAIFQFVTNFQVAFQPQIVKSYAAKDYDYFMRLIFRTVKISFCLLFFFVLPLSINAKFVLQVWLNNVPEYTVVFIQLILAFSLIRATLGPFWMSIQATGDIKRYEVIASCFLFANLPFSFLSLWMGFSPIGVLFIRIGLEAVLFAVLVFYLGARIELPIFKFFCEVILPIFIIAGISSFVTIFSMNIFVGNWNRLIISCIISTISIGCLMYQFGLSKQDKISLLNWIKKTSRRIPQ